LALSLYKKGLWAAPYHARNQNSAGISAFKTGQNDSAVAYFTEAIRLARSWDEPYLNWMALLYASPNTQEKAYQMMATLPAYKPDPRWPLFKKVLLESHLKAWRPKESPTNQARIDQLLADPAFPAEAYSLYERAPNKDLFWR
jgi:tetratricopeptide (TPR) repeat protein